MSSGVVPAALRERSVISLRRSSRVLGLGALPPASSSYDKTLVCLSKYRRHDTMNAVPARTQSRFDLGHEFLRDRAS